MIFSLVSGEIANVIFSFIYPDSQSIGGSPVVFSLIALILVFQLLKKDAPEFKLKTTCGQWIVGYAILGNIPIFSGNISTLVVHAIAFFAAFILGTAGCKMNII